MSTLPPVPSYDPNIPIISSGGGTSSAYKDPNSPESIMKKTATLDAQAKMDSRYNVQENFMNTPFSPFRIFLLVLFLCGILYKLKVVKQKLLLFSIGILSFLLISRIENVRTYSTNSYFKF